MLKARGYYTFTSEGKAVTLRFNTWAGNRFCQIKGIEFNDYLTHLSGAMTPDTIALLLLCAHESYCLATKVPFEASEYDSFTWFDDLRNDKDAMSGLIEAIKEGNEVKGEVSEKKKASR